MIDLGTLSGTVAINGVEDAVRNLGSVSTASNQAGQGIERFAITSKQAKVALTGLATALTAIVGVSGKMANNLNKATNSLAVQTGATAAEMDGLKDSIKAIYADNYGEDFDDIAQSMANVKQQTQLTGDALKETTENALAMRDSFDMEVGESIRGVDMMMKQFGITSEEAYNLIAQGAQKGLDKNQNLLDSVNEYSVHFKQLGFSANDMFNMFANGAEAGIFDIDKLGDAVKEFGIRAKDASDTTIQAYEMLGLNADELTKKFALGGEEANKAFKEVTEALANCNDKVAQNTAGVNLFGTLWEDSGEKVITALSNVNGSLDMTKESMNQIKEIKYDDIGSAFEGIKRQLEVDILEPFGQKLLPYLNELAQWIEDHKDEIEQKLGATLDKVANGIQFVTKNLNTIIPVAQAALGTLVGLKVVGTVASAFNNASQAAHGFETALNFLQANPIALVITGIATAIAAVTAAAKKAEDQQKKWDDQLKETMELNADKTAGDTTELEKERNLLETQINQYKQIAQEREKLMSKFNELDNKYNNGGYNALTAQEAQEYDDLQQKLSDLGMTYDEVTKKVAKQYGSLEVAEQKLAAYNNRIDAAKKATKDLEAAKTSEGKKLLEEAQKLESSADKAQELYDRYKQLEKQSKKSSSAQKEMKEIVEELSEIMTANVTTTDKNTGALILNKGTLEVAIADTNKQAKAKREEAASVKDATAAYSQSTDAYTDASTTRTSLSKEEAEAAIKATEAQMALLQSSGRGTTSAYAALVDKVTDLKKQLKQINAQAEVTNVAPGVTEQTEQDKKEEKDKLELAKETYNQKKKLGKMSLREQLENLKQLKANYSDTVEHIIEVNEFAQSESLDAIENIAEAEKLSTKDKIKLYEDAKERYCKTYSDKKAFTEKINEAIKEDTEGLVDDVSSLSDKDLDKLKKTIEKKKAEYKNYKDAVETLEKELTKVKEEQYNREVQANKEAVDKIIEERNRLYNKAVDDLDKQAKKEKEALQQQLDIIEAQKKAEDLKKQDVEYRQKIDQAETPEDKKKLQDEYAKWKKDLDFEAQKAAITQQMTNIDKQLEQKKETLKKGHEEEIESINQYKTLEEEKAKIKKENTKLTEDEVLKIIESNHEKQQQLMDEQLENYKNQISTLNGLNNTDYAGLVDYKTDLSNSQKSADQFTSIYNHAVNEIGDIRSAVEQGFTSAINRVKQGNRDNGDIVLQVDGTKLARAVLPEALRELTRMGVRLL